VGGRYYIEGMARIMNERRIPMRATILIVILMVAVFTCGCTVMTVDQKNWICDKANRSAAYVQLMDKGLTTRQQDQAWIRSQNRSWQLWAENIKMGLAAPSWMTSPKEVRNESK